MKTTNNITICENKKDQEGLPLLATPKPESHRLLGLTLVAASAFSFSLVSTCVKFETYSLMSMETVFWRAGIAWLFNLVS